MSSASAVAVVAIPEATYGQTPALAGATGHAVRFTTESLSGTPQTTQSAELRTDRMSGGQVVVGLESGGDINFELSKDPMYDAFLEGAMMSNWVGGHQIAAGATTIAKNSAPDDQTATLTITGSTADFDGAGRALAAGDVLVLSGFTNAANNVPVQIISVDSATTLTVVVSKAMVNEVAALGIVHLPDHVDIGSLIHSWTLIKAYTDVLHGATANEHGQHYTGSIVNTMSLAVAYGEIVTGTFGFLSNGYEQDNPSLRQKLITAGGTIRPAGTAKPLNGSVDMPIVTVNGLPTDFCIQNVNLSLENGATPQTCIGKAAPTKYNLGTANITLDMTVYMGDQAWDQFGRAKLTQEPVSLMFAALNNNGGYAFDVRAAQLSFPDPNAAGDQPVVIDMSGVAKVGDGGASAMRIWKW